ncbi:transposase [Chryseobacterium sp. JUb7]|nr:transposase [Chryseobacterium sp. JUb7]
MKTDCQWRELSLKEYFSNETISWQLIYYYFNKWCKDGSFRRIWISLLGHNKRELDLSGVQMDGSHTRSRTGGESVGYQGRKSSGTTNCISLCDNQGQMLSMGKPIGGEHHDLYNIEETLDDILGVLHDADIDCKGLFLNADSGFDSKKFRNILVQKEIIGNIKENPRNGDTKHERYFDNILYKRRFKIEKQMFSNLNTKNYIIK